MLPRFSILPCVINFFVSAFGVSVFYFRVLEPETNRGVCSLVRLCNRQSFVRSFTHSFVCQVVPAFISSIFCLEGRRIYGYCLCVKKSRRIASRLVVSLSSLSIYGYKRSNFARRRLIKRVQSRCTILREWVSLESEQVSELVR